MFKHVFLISFLLPVASRAQYVQGTYALAENPQRNYRTAMQVSGNGLKIKAEKGKAARVPAAAILYAKTANHQTFVPASGFLVPAGVAYQTMPSTLVELLDSGRVSLLRYESSTAGVKGYDGTYEQTGQVSVYLARPAGAAEAVSLPPYAWTNGGVKLHAALRPYAAGRPDLLALLAGSTIREFSLPAFFHALNSGQPFVKP